MARWPSALSRLIKYRYNKIIYVQLFPSQVAENSAQVEGHRLLLGRAARTAGEVVPHGAKETSLRLLIVEGLTASHVGGIAVTLQGHETFERRA